MKFESSNLNSLFNFADGEVREYAISNGIVAPDPRPTSFGEPQGPIAIGLDDIDGRTSSDDADLADTPGSWTIV